MTALALLCVSVSNLHAAGKPALGDGLSFYAGFEGTDEPAYARGASTAGGNYVQTDGVVGKGVDVGSGPPSYSQPGNLDRTEGTLSFWIKPSIDMARHVGQGEAIRHIIKAVVFQFSAYVNLPNTTPAIYFMTGTSLPGQDFQWDYGTTAPINSLPAEQWTHVALTWNTPKKQKSIYINGKRVANQTTPLMLDGDSGEGFTLGEGLPGAYDELAIWNRVLTPLEISQLAQKPADAAETLNTAAGMKADEKAGQTVQWTIYPELIYQNYADSLIEPNEELALNLPLENRGDKQQAGVVTIEVQDVWDRPVGKAQTFNVDLAAGEKKELPFKVAVDHYGAFRIAVTVDVGGKKAGRDVTTFGCLPKDPPPIHPFFGGHISQVGTIPQMGRRLGFARNRVHNMTQFTWWCRMEPQRGDWAMQGFGTYQHYMDLGYTHYGQWMYAPYWSVTLPDGSHPVDPGNEVGWRPTDMEAMKIYVRESLKRFPEIKEWEIWNEPYVSMFWQGSAKDYVDMCRVVYTEAKKDRPDITVYAQLYYEGPWTRDAMKLGVLNYCDAVAYHNYMQPNGDPQAAAEPVRKLRALLKAFGRPDMPIICSESGMNCTTFLRGLDFKQLPPPSVRQPMDYRQAAEELVQAHVVMMAAGVQAWYYYFHQPVLPTAEGVWPYVNYSTLEVTRSPKPMAISRAQLVWQLDGGHFVSEMQTAADGVRAYAFERQDGHAVAVLWAENGASAQLKVPAGMNVVELMGNPVQSPSVEIAHTPLYLHATDVAQLQSALRDGSVITSTRPPQKIGSSTGGVAPPMKMEDFSIASEVGPGKLVPLDLSPFANMARADEQLGDGKGGWMDEGPYNDGRDLRPGKHTWLGVPFVVGGQNDTDPAVITLKGRTFPNGPQEVGPIAVNRKLRGLFFVHTANWTQIGKTVGEYIIHYTDGKDVKLPIIVGQNIGDWWSDHLEGEDSRTVGFKAANPLEPASPYRYLRIWYWENTRSDATIESISVRSLNNDMTFTVVAVTAATH